MPLLRYFVRGPLQGEVTGIAWPARQASYLGIAGLGLGLLGILYGGRRRAVWFLVWVSIAFFILSLGPRLNLGSHDLDPSSALPFMLPFYYVSRLPILGHVREAHRYALIGWLAWTSLAAVGLACVFRQLRRRWPRMTWLAPVMAGLLALGSVIDFAQWPFPMLFRPPSIPAGFQVIAEDPRESSVLEFPAGRMGDPSFSWFQTLHRKPVYLDGELARIPPALAKRKERSPLMRELGRAFQGEAVPERGISRLREILGREVRQKRIGWVILSWADFKTLFRRTEVPDQRIQTLDRLIRKALPVEEVIYFGGPEALKRWKALRPRARLSQSSIFAIYRLDFENGGIWQGDEID